MSLKGAGGGEREGVGATGGGGGGSAELLTRLKSAGSVSSGGSLALQAAGAIV